VQRRAMTVLALVATLVLGPWAVAASAADGDLEREFVTRVNTLRREHGLVPLRVDPELTRASRGWAGHLRGEGRLAHAPDLSVGVTSTWGLLGENVGRGPDVATLFDAFVASPTHLRNLLHPGFRRIGVGVVVGPNGTVWTTHRFLEPTSVTPVGPARPRGGRMPTGAR
jgi:uncharacterized protein YkwD